MTEEDEIEDRGASNPDPRRPIGALIAARLSRRAALAAGAAAAAAAALPVAAQDTGNTPNGGPSTLHFPELRHQLARRDAVAEGHEIQVVIRWGDPILADAPEFDPLAQTADRQARQFGYNCDYLDFFPLPRGAEARGAEARGAEARGAEARGAEARGAEDSRRGAASATSRRASR